MKEEISTALKPMYSEMLSGIKTKKGVCTFCLQWGEDFPFGQHTGILYVGKATNGWVTTSRDCEMLFGNTGDRIFARHDQMKWVHNLEGDVKYNTKSSAFWRVIKTVSKTVYKNEPWYSKVAWSNLFKIAHETGNPNSALKKEQYELCKRILMKEIELLSPKFVVFLTSGRETGFVKYLSGNNDCQWIDTQKWGGKYETKACKVNDTYLICSQHPQGKNEHTHAKAIVDIIKKKIQDDNLAVK
jgi:uracil-DNA glycosylase